jgi:hypothetical protein
VKTNQTKIFSDDKPHNVVTDINELLKLHNLILHNISRGHEDFEIYELTVFDSSVE